MSRITTIALCLFGTIPLAPAAQAGLVTMAGTQIEVSNDAQTLLEPARAKLFEGKVGECREMVAKVVETIGDLPHQDVLVSLWLVDIGQIQPAMQLLEQLSRQEQDRPDLHYGFAELARKTGRSYDAWTHLTVAETASRPEGWSEQFGAEFVRSIVLSKAQVAESRANWIAAKALYERLQETGESGLQIELGLGRSEFKLGNASEAEKHFRAAADLAPETQIPETLMASLYAEQGNTAETEAWLKKGEAENAKHADKIRLEHAMWLLREQRAPEAVRLAQAAIQEKSEMADRYKLVLALALYMYEKYDEAEAELSRLSQKEPDNFLFSNQLALTLVESSDEAKRARALQIAVANANALSNSSSDVLATLAYVQFRLGDLKSAEQTAGVLVRRGGQLSRDSTYFLSQVLAKLGNSQEADSLLQAARNSKGEFFNFRKLEKSLTTPEAK